MTNPAAPAYPLLPQLTDGWLHCPRCNGDNLHQDAVTVYQRDAEDGPATASHVTRSATITSRTTSAPNRRDTLVIQFTCENCDESFTPNVPPGPGVFLEICQWKGTTLVTWLTPQQVSALPGRATP